MQRVAEYNPSLSLNEVCIDGECLGMLVAEISESETPNDEHALFFEREADGHLVLVGYAYRGDTEVQRLYKFRVKDHPLTLTPAASVGD